MQAGTYFGCVLTAILALSVPPTMADEPDPKATVDEPDSKTDPKSDPNQQPSVWMRRKLDYSQKILSGLTAADFDAIADNARKMKMLDRIELFVRGRSPSYRAQFAIFQDASDELILQSEKKNIEGAALAFTQLTISCVQCHKRLRERPADPTSPPPSP